jgi:hypothetical protein
VDGELSWRLFEQVVGSAINDLRTTHETPRAFGEMVGLLWSAGRVSASVREEYWNRLLEDHAVSLIAPTPSTSSTPDLFRSPTAASRFDVIASKAYALLFTLSG